jgi:OFA family oxalate/formate antiporter-like MFS transporter
VEAVDHWPPLLVGAVFSGTPLGYGIGMLVGGRLADVLPPRRICWSAILLFAFGLAVAFTFPSGFAFVVFYAMLGLGIGGGLAMAGSLAAGAHFYPHRVGAVGGALTAAYAAGGLVQLPIATQLAPAIGWLPALRLLALASLLVAALLLGLLPAVPRPLTAHLEERVTLGRLFVRPRVWTGFLLQALSASVGTYAFLAIAGYAHTHRLGLAVATLAVTGAAAGNVLARAAAGAASDRFGVDAVLLGVLGSNLLATAIFAAGSDSAVAVVVASVAAGAGFGGTAGLNSKAGSLSAPDAPNTSFGVHFAGFSLGALAGPLIGSALGGGSPSWLAVGAPSLAGLVVVGLRAVTTRAAGPAPAR